MARGCLERLEEMEMAQGRMDNRLVSLETAEANAPHDLAIAALCVRVDKLEEEKGTRELKLGNYASSQVTASMGSAEEQRLSKLEALREALKRAWPKKVRDLYIGSEWEQVAKLLAQLED